MKDDKERMKEWAQGNKEPKPITHGFPLTF
jgi:hypothetical protein